MAKCRPHIVVCCVALMYVLPLVGLSVVGRVVLLSVVAWYIGVCNVGFGFLGMTFNTRRYS